MRSVRRRVLVLAAATVAVAACGRPSDGDICSANLDATLVPAARNFIGVRTAVTATQMGASVPVAVDAAAL